jgi:hypothetical protein
LISQRDIQETKKIIIMSDVFGVEFCPTKILLQGKRVSILYCLLCLKTDDTDIINYRCLIAPDKNIIRKRPENEAKAIRIESSSCCSNNIKNRLNILNDSLIWIRSISQAYKKPIIYFCCNDVYLSSTVKEWLKIWNKNNWKIKEELLIYSDNLKEIWETYKHLKIRSRWASEEDDIMKDLWKD